MASVPQFQEESAPVPFFEDKRTISEKLKAEDREWRPHEPQHKCPEVIFGLVLERGRYFSKFNKEHETARVLTADNTVWSVITFHGYLQSEFERKTPRVGDYIAIAYLGTRPAKKQGESDANVYRIEVERNPSAVSVEENYTGNEVLVGSDPTPPLPEPPPIPEPLIEKQRRAQASIDEIEGEEVAVDDDIPF